MHGYGIISGHFARRCSNVEFCYVYVTKPLETEILYPCRLGVFLCFVAKQNVHYYNICTIIVQKSNLSLKQWPMFIKLRQRIIYDNHVNCKRYYIGHNIYQLFMYKKDLDIERPGHWCHPLQIPATRLTLNKVNELTMIYDFSGR